MPEKEPLSSPKKNMLNKGLVMPDQNSLVDNQNYLVTDQVAPFYKEWLTLFHTEDMKLDVSPNHSFNITLNLKYPEFVDVEDDLNVAKVFVGIKDQQKEYQESIEMGIYMGRLFIKDVFDATSIEREKLVNGVKIVLTVSPRQNGKSSAQLKVLDQYGLALAIIKTNKFLSTDWNGEISTGAHFKSLSIEGTKSTY